MKIVRNVCRFCMDETATLVNIFTDVRDPTLDRPEMNLSDILVQCTNRPVERGDLLPQYICLSCVLAAQNAFRFKWKSERSYQHYCQVLKQPYLPENKMESGPHQEQKVEAQLRTNSYKYQNLHQKPIQGDRRSHQQQKLESQIDQNHADVPAEFNSIPDLRKRPTAGRAKMMQRRVRSDANGNYKCPHCPKMFSSQTQLRAHISNMCHRCPYCPRSCTNKYNLRRHLLTHISKPTHKCPHCAKAFVRKDYLKRHLRSHDNDGPLSCSECSAVFSEGLQLKIHRREHLPKLGSIESDSTKDLDSELSDQEQEQDMKPQCAENSISGRRSKGQSLPKPTGDTFFDKENLSSHNVLGPKLLRNWDPLKPDVSFQRSTSEEADPKNNDMSFLTNSKPKCHVCFKDFFSNSNLRRHMLIHNRGPDPVKCSYCSKEFRTESHLKRHERGHSGDLFRCEFCCLVFVDVEYLRKHKKRIHSNTLASIQGKIMSKRMAIPATIYERA
ncbi:uncharacterized zinc finger protein CG2678 isoform X2 [Drosophila gunungcola]|uniref:uncharacterized zinc finger protein CG2678 isoform X2 n=1 Tax=Drosophila gunungcola TaxID=103775 RepID=UPI0022E611C6|nr:uncharacterized zinc finger protein CG2678 isoform X2 [Drosophila gunungcola]